MNLNDVVWASNMRDPSGFAYTSPLGSIRIAENYIEQLHAKQSEWPDLVMNGRGINANPIVIAKLAGTWHGGTYEWIDPHTGEKFRKSLGGDVKHSLGPHVKQGPLANWIPAKGEPVGFMTASCCRNGTRTIDERTNVVIVEWPF